MKRALAIIGLLGAAIGILSCPAPAPVSNDRAANQATTANAPANAPTNNANSVYDVKGALANSSASNTASLPPPPPVDRVMVAIEGSLSEWAPENDHIPATLLKTIWVESGRHPWKYYPKGVLKLLADIRKEDLFKECQRAKDLKLMMFDTGGEIQTVANLYTELYYCDSNN